MKLGALFHDRSHAGRELASHLLHFRGADAVVVALAPGGVPVAAELADGLGAPLDVCVVGSVASALEPDATLATVSEDGAVFVDPGLISSMPFRPDALAQLLAARRAEVASRAERLRRGRKPIDVRDRIVIVVDAGVSSGATARAALRSLRARGATKLVFAVPVGRASTLRALEAQADVVVCPNPKSPYYDVGAWYHQLGVVSEQEIAATLSRASTERSRALPLFS